MVRNSISDRCAVEIKWARLLLDRKRVVVNVSSPDLSEPEKAVIIEVHLLEPNMCVPIRKVKRIRRADGPIRSFLTGQISHFRLLGVADEPKTVYKTTSTEDLESIVVALMNRRNLKLAEEVLAGDGGEEKEGAAVADGDEQHAGMEDDGDDDESPSYRLSTCHFPLSD
jgi:hypothetical protein